jgi:hypothetical protein
MSALRVTQPFAAFIMVCIILGCTSTKFSAIWKDETYPGNPAKILVINTFKDPSIRRHFQDEMVKALKDRKVDAVAKHTTLPPDQVVADRDALAAQAKEVGADTVLITRPAGTSGHSYFNTHTDVYDMKTNKLIAFVSAETRMQAGSPDPRDYISYVPSYVKDLVQKLSKAGLF